jgi:hypothetical protein
MVWVVLVLSINSFTAREAYAQPTNRIERTDFVVTGEGASDASSLRQIADWVDSMRSVLGELHWPDHLEIVVNDSITRNSVDLLARKIYLGSKFSLFSVKHEVGHRVLDTNLALSIPECDWNHQERDRIFELARQIETETNEDAKKSLKQLETSLVEKLYESPVEILRGPYDEFFADTVSVLTSRNGQEAALAHKDRSRDFTPLGVRPRFGARPEFHDPHVFFFDSKRLLWSEFIKKGLTPEAGREILRIVLDAISIELKVRIADKSLLNLSPEQLDARMKAVLLRKFSSSRKTK